MTVVMLCTKSAAILWIASSAHNLKTVDVVPGSRSGILAIGLEEGQGKFARNLGL